MQFFVYIYIRVCIHICVCVAYISIVFSPFLPGCARPDAAFGASGRGTQSISDVTFICLRKTRYIQKFYKKSIYNSWKVVDIIICLMRDLLQCTLYITVQHFEFNVNDTWYVFIGEHMPLR